MSEDLNFSGVRVKCGLNTDTMQPFWYPEVRLRRVGALKGKWVKCIKNGKWLTFTNEEDAHAEVNSLRARNQEHTNG